MHLDKSQTNRYSSNDRNDRVGGALACGQWYVVIGSSSIVEVVVFGELPFPQAVLAVRVRYNTV